MIAKSQDGIPAVFGGDRENSKTTSYLMIDGDYEVPLTPADLALLVARRLYFLILQKLKV